MNNIMQILDLSFRSFRTHTFVYPEGLEEREEILQGLESRIVDIKTVSRMIPSSFYFEELHSL